MHRDRAKIVGRHKKTGASAPIRGARGVRVLKALEKRVHVLERAPARKPPDDAGRRAVNLPFARSLCGATRLESCRYAPGSCRRSRHHELAVIRIERFVTVSASRPSTRQSLPAGRAALLTNRRTRAGFRGQVRQPHAGSRLHAADLAAIEALSPGSRRCGELAVCWCTPVYSRLIRKIARRRRVERR
jgi:hypothetical protein